MTHDDITSTLHDAAGGDDRAADALLQTLYTALVDLAASKLARETPGHTLAPAALVHEAYLKLVDQKRVSWQGRTHFQAVAARAMERALIDHARKKKREKRGGGWQRVTLDDAYALSRDGGAVDFDALHQVLQRMRKLDPRQAEVVELRVFCGLAPEDAAEVLGVSRRTVDRDWKMARAWLRRELAGLENG